VKISIIGAGYVGLVTGACLAERGHGVVCVDVDAAKVDAINRGAPPIHEQGLPELLRKHAGKSLTATTGLAAAVLSSEITFIAAGTPFDGREIDLRHVKAVALGVGTALKRKAGYHVVVVKSTVVPGTTDSVALPILEQASGKRAGKDFGVGMNPEFLSEGVAVADFMSPDRIVLGGIDARTQDVLAGVYASFPEDVPRLRTNNATAEMVKYASNALQATMISFANEFANLCAALPDVDAIDVMKGVHAMKELTVPVNPKLLAAGGSRRSAAPITNFLLPGCGFGGSCFPKDLKAIASHAQKLGTLMPILECVMAVNQNQPRRMVDLLQTRIPSLRGKRVAVLGLAFKPGTDDVRESPAMPVIRELLAEGAIVRACDPVAVSEARKVLPDTVELTHDVSRALDGAAAVLLVTKWEQFRAAPDLIRAMSPPPVFVDGRRMFATDCVPDYLGVGLSSKGRGSI
jgi:UDPglucose 6-dehydrogenase/GDP-mannose 6-dehydrogenase